MPPVTPVTKHKALLIEDNPGDVRLIRLHLADAPHAPFELVHADKLSAGLERLAGGDIDLVLLDMSLPDSFGLDTFKRAHAAAPQVPIIVLSGLDDESVAVQKTVSVAVQKCVPSVKTGMNTVCESVPVTKTVSVAVQKCVPSVKTGVNTVKEIVS